MTSTETLPFTLHGQIPDENAHETHNVKVKKVNCGQTLADFRFQPDDCYHGNQKSVGLTDGTKSYLNQHHVAGYLNKIRRDSVSGKHKEARKVPLVRANSKVSFKPNAGRKVARKEITVAIPQHVAPSDTEFSPMAVDSPMVNVSFFNKKPKDIEDIDAVNDPLKCSDYAQDVIDYLQVIEKKNPIPKNYLANKRCDIAPGLRLMLVDWLIQVQEHQSLSQHALHLCVNMTDKFLCTNPIKPDTVQLVGITCLLLAAKYHERFPPLISDLIYLTDDTYTRDQVLKMERFILRKLDFNLNLPGPVTFLERFLMIDQCEKKDLIQSMSMYLIDITMTDVYFVHIKPSLIAACAIYVSRELLGSKCYWNKTFTHYTKYSEKDLIGCSQAMKRCLAKTIKSKYVGAKTKYASDAYHSISKHKVLKPLELWPDHPVEDVNEK
ncbi:hypothetical protein ACF0H5_006452 [Mactra antiquata]